MRDNLGIGFRNKFKTLLFKKFAQLEVVFDNTVVYHRKLARTAEMRVRVRVGRLAVRCPPCVSDSDVARKCLAASGFLFENRQTPLCLYHIELSVIQNCKPRRVITSVFELFKTLQKNRSRLFVTYISNYSAHKIFLQDIKFQYCTKMYCTLFLQYCQYFLNYYLVLSIFFQFYVFL